MTITTEEAQRLAERVAHDAEAPQAARYQPYTDHAMRDAAAALRSFAAERDALQARVAELEGALKDAAASVKEWGAYASQYLQDELGLPGEVARYIAIAEGKNDAALEGKKDG